MASVEGKAKSMKGKMRVGILLRGHASLSPMQKDQELQALPYTLKHPQAPVTEWMNPIHPPTTWGQAI